MTKPDGRDVHFYGGLAMLAAGCWFVYWPSALIVTGMILVYMAIWRMV